jgi:predicted ATPase
MKGLTQPEHLYQVVAPDLPADFPPLKTLDTFPNNLPIQLTSFIGRERELTEAKEKLASARLLTFIGPGGTGKTRLSLQLAADLLPTFTDGVWLVELAPLADPSLILQTIASVFGVREQRGMSLMDIVVNYLRAKHLLLILDNCEHLVEACAQLTDQFLHASPNLKIIASSREALGINGETVYRVPSLTLPNQAPASREALTQCEAVQLFVERAAAANPKFHLTDKNASSVAQICRRLDGIPLALELAAARVTVFSPEQIASRLDDRFKLLTGGSRTALPRQQTLRALIDWSYDILSDDERALLRRFSVFASGWTFEAAEAIGSDLDVLNVLTQLVNKSLVAVDDEGEATRYRLLETIRQYARDKLLEANEAERLRNLHLDYFGNLAERESPKIEGREIIETLRRLEAEHDNFRAALEWGLENNVEATLRLVGALAYTWFLRGHALEGLRWANEVLTRAEALPTLQGEAARQQMVIRAKALQALSFLAYSQGDNPAARKAGEACITLARQLDDRRMLAIALGFAGAAKLFLGDPAGASASIEESVALARESGDKFALGAALNIRAQYTSVIERDFKAARAYEDEGIALMNEVGSHWGASIAFFSSGMAAKLRGDYAAARAQFSKCLPLFQEMEDEHRVNMVRSELAHLERYEGHYQQAEETYRKTIRVWQKLGHRAAIAHQFESFAFIAKVHEQAERAARLFGAAEALREKISIPMSPPEQIEYNREVADLRAGMDEKAFTSLWGEGRALAMEAAIEYALKETDAPPRA